MPDLPAAHPQPSPPAQGTLSELWVYPIKSCAGVRLDAAPLLATGLQWDRHWMVVDTQGRFVTQRTHPRMALLHTALTADELVVTAPHHPALGPLRIALDALGMLNGNGDDRERRPVQVWKSNLPALDEGDAAARWLAAALGDATLRLVRFDPRERRACSADWLQGHAAHTEFADGFPLLVTTASAMDGLNARLQAAGAAPVDMRRFRPNLVLTGFEPHAEDRMHSLTLADGAVHLLPVKPCTRCPMPDVDPDTAQTGHAVRTALKAYRADASLNGALTFGQNAIVLAGSGLVLRTGTAVQAVWRS